MSNHSSGSQGNGHFSGSQGNGRRRVRMIREAGQSLVLSRLCEGAGGGDDSQSVEVRVSQVCAGGAAIIELLLPDNVFVERKETLEGVRALFTLAPAPAIKAVHRE